MMVLNDDEQEVSQLMYHVGMFSKAKIIEIPCGHGVICF